ncbi:MAG: hypothetical protein GYA24_16945 [Candidatus Lokiarchaeota archaeon]|nr:hypothetical protein [Candidatus Lokiarchaeota archaeon]
MMRAICTTFKVSPSILVTDHDIIQCAGRAPIITALIVVGLETSCAVLALVTHGTVSSSARQCSRTWKRGSC